jgi:long-subunit acyl-CoA synthetase (AMP-forming)
VLVAVIVPDADIAKQWASENGVAEEGQMAALCGNAKFKAAVMAQMKSAGSSAALKGFEVVRDIHLEAELFSVDNDLLTPTFKLKRPQVCALPSVQHAAASLHHVYAYTELSSHGLSPPLCRPKSSTRSRLRKCTAYSTRPKQPSPKLPV